MNRRLRVCVRERDTHYIYLCLLKERVYKTKIKGKTVTLNKVKLQIEIGNGLHLGTGEYKQDKEMSDKIEEIYLYYYNQRTI